MNLAVQKAGIQDFRPGFERAGQRMTLCLVSELEAAAHAVLSGVGGRPNIKASFQA